MSSEIVGYLLWRLGARGTIVPEKFLKVHRDHKLTNPNHQEGEAYRRNLLQEVPLGLEDWGLSLRRLVEKYPYPREEIGGTHGSNQAQPSA